MAALPASVAPFLGVAPRHPLPPRLAALRHAFTFLDFPAEVLCAGVVCTRWRMLAAADGRWREKLYEVASRVCQKVWIEIGRPKVGAWPKLSPSLQGKMNSAIVMMQEAMDQVSGGVGWWHS